MVVYSSANVTRQVCLLGGVGFYSKSKPPDGLIEVFCMVGQGNNVFPYEKHEAKTGLRLSSMPSRELEMIEILSLGYSNRKIASKFVISANTVKYHLKNIYEKSQVDNSTQAVAFYNQLYKDEL